MALGKRKGREALVVRRPPALGRAYLPFLAFLALAFFAIVSASISDTAGRIAEHILGGGTAGRSVDTGGYVSLPGWSR